MSGSAGVAVLEGSLVPSAPPKIAEEGLGGWGRLNALEGTEVRQATEKVRALEKQLSQQERLVAQLSASFATAEQDLLVREG